MCILFTISSLTWPLVSICVFFFFFNDTATTEIYTLSLHDALPISVSVGPGLRVFTRIPRSTSSALRIRARWATAALQNTLSRSEEHTSELQSPDHLLCRLLLEKKTISRYYVHQLVPSQWQRVKPGT